MVKRALIVMMIIALMVPVGQAMAAETTTATEIEVTFSPLHYLVDGVEYAPQIDTKDKQKLQGFLYNNRTYVPIRFVSNILYQSVEWDGALSKVTISAPDPSVDSELVSRTVNNPKIEPVDGSKLKKEKITVSFRDLVYEMNGKRVDSPDENLRGFIFKGSTYVPLSFIYESLGYKPDWDKVTRTITATSSAEQLAYKKIVKAANAETEKIFDDVYDVIWKNIVGPVLAGKPTDEEKKVLREKGEGYLADGLVLLNAALKKFEANVKESGFSAEVVTKYEIYYEKEEARYRGIGDQFLGPKE